MWATRKYEEKTEHVMLKMIVMMRNKVGNENDVAKMTTTIMKR